MKFHSYFPLTLAARLAPALAQYAPLVLTPSEDTWVNKAQPNTNFFLSSTQGHRGPPSVGDAKEAFIRIDVPVGYDAGCAFLALDGYNFNTSNVVEIATVAATTDLMTVTWNNRPLDATVFDTVPVGPIPGIMTFDISPLVSPGTSTVLRMRLLNSGWCNFRSLESTSGSAPEVRMDLAVLSPTEDTWVQKNAPSATHGGDGYLAMRGSPSVGDAKEGYLRFAVPAGIHVESASLILYSYNLNTSNTAEVARVFVTGSVDNLTWNSRPSNGPVLDTKPISSVDGYQIYDVTDAVHAGQTADLRVRFMGNGWGWYGSQEAATAENRPVLVINHDACEPLGTIYCTPNVPNSSGQPAEIEATGSKFAGGFDLTLIARQLPQGQFGYFLTSQAQALISQPGNSNGNLCVGGNIGRFTGSGQIGNSGSSGEFRVSIDTLWMPVNPPQPVLAGETWNFQGWYRDIANTSNFTDAVEITFR